MVLEQELQNMTTEQISEMQKQNCIFCRIIAGEIPSKIVYQDDVCMAVLDVNPANEGHTIIIPKQHMQIMPQISQEQLSHMFVISKKISKALLMSTLGKSTSIFAANGAAAGQKAPHFMIHVIPRKNEQEFFSLSSNEVSQEDLEKARQSISARLTQLIGKKPVQQALPKFQEQPLPEPEPVEVPIEAQSSETAGADEPEHKKGEQIEELEEPKLVKLGIKKERGYFYYVDKDGDVARVPMKWKEKQEKEKERFDKKTDLDKIANMLLGGQK